MSCLVAFCCPQKYSSNREALQALEGRIDEFSKLVQSVPPREMGDRPQEVSDDSESFKL